MRIQILILAFKGLIITVTVSPVKIDFPYRYEVVGGVPTKSESKGIKSFRGIR